MDKPSNEKPTLLRFRNIALGLLLLLALAATGWWLFKPAKADSTTRYRTQTLSKTDLVQTASATGTLNPVKVVSVGTQVSGTVRKLYVDFNSRVEKGQVLLEIDSEQSDAQLRQTRASLTSAQARLKLAKANAERQRNLFQREYVSRQDVEQAEADLGVAAATVAQVKAQVDRDQITVNNTIIRAPVSGVVIDRQVDAGQTVAASFQTPTLIKIAQDLSTMQIDANFAEADLGRIKEGLSATYRVDAFPERSFNGLVRQIRLNPTTQQNVVTYDVVIDTNNPGQRLLPGMTAYVDIEVGRRDQVLAVPNAALRFKPDDPALRGGESKGREAGKPGGNAQGREKQAGDKQAGSKRDGNKPETPAQEGSAPQPGTSDSAVPGSPSASASADASTANRNSAGRGPEARGENRRPGRSGTVYVLRENTLQAVRLRLGLNDGRQTEVTEGELKAGDVVVIADLQASSANKVAGQPGSTPAVMPRRF